MIKVKVNVARSEAILRGIAAEGEHVLSVGEEFLARLSTAEKKKLAFTSSPFWVTNPSEEGLYEAIRAAVESDEKQLLEQAEREAAQAARDLEILAKVIAGDPEKEIRDGSQSSYLQRMLREHPDRQDLKDFALRVDQVLEERRAQEAAAKAARELERAEKAAEDARLVEVWASYRRAFVAERPSMAARDAEGLLPEKEVRDGIRERLFEVFDTYASEKVDAALTRPRYVRIKAADVSHHEECLNPTAFFECEESAGLSEQAFDVLCELRAVAKASPQPATVTAFDHRASCSTCGETVKRQSAEVRIEIGDQTFTRRYAL